jgi:DNA-binding NtrC family response regulator
VGFARDAGVNLWYSDGAMCVLLETHSDHQTANSSRGGVESMNILVVDDDATTLTYVSETLRTAGHRVIAMADARQAVKTIERGGIDLLMSDVSMPGMTGPELAADARRLRPELPVLLMSGSTQVDGYPFLAKPFKMQDLLNALHRALAFSASTAHPRPWQFDRLSSRTHQADGGARTDTGMPPRRTDGS